MCKRGGKSKKMKDGRSRLNNYLLVILDKGRSCKPT